MSAGILSVLTIAAMTAATAGIARAKVIDRVVASVDGSPITLHDIQVFKAGGIAGQLGGGPVPSSNSAILKALITQKMLELESQKYASQVTSDELTRYIQNLEHENHVTDAELRAQLQSQGISYKEFRAHVRKQVEAMTMIDQEIRQKIVIPDSQVEAYYKSHPEEFESHDERYKLAQILIAVPENAPPAQIQAAREKAESIRKKLLAGASFAAMAEKYSDDDSKTKGGELGYFKPSSLDTSVLDAIENVKPGGITQVVQTKYGFHILKVEEHQTPGLKPLSEVASQIRDHLMTEEAKSKFQSWVDHDLIKKHYVEVMGQP